MKIQLRRQETHVKESPSHWLKMKTQRLNEMQEENKTVEQIKVRFTFNIQQI